MNKFLSHISVKIIFLLVMIILLCFSFYDYSFRNEQRIENNLKSITEESNQQTNVAVSEKLDDQIHILESYASLISQENDITSDRAFKQLEPLLNTELFNRIAITNADGISYTSDHFQHDSSQREYYIEGKKGHTYISNMISSAIDYKDVIVMSVPIYKNSQFAGVLRATLDINRLHEYFDLSILSGNVYSYIIQSDGLNLTQHAEKELNFLDMLTNENNESEIIEKMKTDLSHHELGSITFQLDGNKRFAYYSPIEQTDWFMLTILPQTTIQDEMDYNLQQTVLLALKISSILILTCGYFVYLQFLSSSYLKKMNKRMDAIISNTPGSNYKYELSKPETIVFFKQDNRLLAGYTQEEIISLISTDIYSIISKSDYDNLQEALRNIEPYTVVSNTYRIKNKENKIQWVFDQRQIISEDNKLKYFVEVIDITELKKVQEQLMISEERYQLILKETESVIYEWDTYTDQITFSDLWTSKYGYPNQLNDFLVLTNELYSSKENTYIPLIEEMVAGNVESDQIECLLPLANGKEIWVKIYAKAILDEQGVLLRIVGSISDISQEKQKSLQLLERAQRDSLTKVYNRMTLENLISEDLNNYSEFCHIMFVIDIDDFKVINDTFGHASGDEALTKFTNALMSNFRENDIVGRLGGDEFIVFMRYPHQYPEYQIERKCHSFLDKISEIHLEKDKNYQIQCSIGVALYPQDGKNYQELFDCADRRMYLAKKKGKNTFIYQDINKNE